MGKQQRGGLRKRKARRKDRVSNAKRRRGKGGQHGLSRLLSQPGMPTPCLVCSPPCQCCLPSPYIRRSLFVRGSVWQQMVPHAIPAVTTRQLLLGVCSFSVDGPPPPSTPPPQSATRDRLSAWPCREQQDASPWRCELFMHRERPRISAEPEETCVPRHTNNPAYCLTQTQLHTAPTVEHCTPPPSLSCAQCSVAPSGVPLAIHHASLSFSSLSASVSHLHTYIANLK